MLAVLAPSLVTLVAWFFVAPDPRFAFAPIWLVPASLVAWALPPLLRPSARTAGLVAAGSVLAAIGLAALGESDTVWMLPAALAGIAGVVLLARVGSSAWIAVGAMAAVLVAGLLVAAHEGKVGFVTAKGSGPLRLPLPAPPTLMPVVTDSGLQLTQPVNGGDQCFQAILCVPLLISPSLHMRGASVSQGFSVSLSR